MSRTFRLFELGFRELCGVPIPSGVRIEERTTSGWMYHSVQPDMESAKSLVSNMGRKAASSSVKRGVGPLIVSFT